MTSKRRLGRVAALVVILAAAMIVAGPTVGQQSRRAPATADEQPTAKKSRGRLPAYFASVVSQKQREEVYQIQADYEEQLAALRGQIEALIAERDQAVDAVLDPDQLAEVKKKREEARKRREARSAARAAAREAEQEEDASSSN